MGVLPIGRDDRFPRGPLEITRPKAEAFPTTRLTLLLQEALQGHPHADMALRRVIMERYAEPLAIYAKGSTLRDIAEPEELVYGFLVQALAEPAYFERYRASGLRMRRWLMNGLLLHARSVARDRARASRREGATIDHISTPASTGSSAEEAFDRAWALAILSEACASVEGALMAEGRDRAWTVFRRHAIDGRNYSELESELGLGRQQMADLVRTVTRRLRARVLELLASEGGNAADDLRDVIRLVT
jgi:hypothetical protein